MSLKRAIVVLAATLGLVACGTPPKFQERRQANATDTFALGTSSLVQQTNHMTQHLNADKTIVYNQPFGGGGVTLGLLLGPIGVAANISMIESITKAETSKLFGKIGIDPVQVFQGAAKAHKIEVRQGASGTGLRLTPYLLVIKTTETSVNVGTAVIYETGAGTPARYMLQLPQTYTLDQLAALDQAGASQLQQSVTNGFDRLMAFFAQEAQVSSSVEGEPKIQFKSSFLAPRFEFEMLGSVVQKDTDVTWIRTYGGVYGLQTAALAVLPGPR